MYVFKAGVVKVKVLEAVRKEELGRRDVEVLVVRGRMLEVLKRMKRERGVVHGDVAWG